MADYRGGGGGGGASVVPASLVVANDREDFPLTQAGVVAALAALAADGGDIYLGAGDLAIASTVTISKNVRIFCAGRGATTITPAAGITMFSIGAVDFSMNDVSIQGDGTAQIALQSSAAGGTIILERVDFPGAGAFGDSVRVIFDADNKAVTITVSECDLLASGGGSLLLDGGSATVFISSSAVVVTGDITLPASSRVAASSLSGTTVVFGATCFMSAGTVNGTVTTGNQCCFSACQITGNTTFGSSCDVSGGTITGTVTTGTSCNMAGVTMGSTLTAGASSTFTACTVSSTAAPAASCLFSGCTIGGAVTVSGASTKFSNCALVSFSSTSLNSHQIVNCSFSGAGNNVTLASSSSCVVTGNVTCQIIESGTSDSNYFTKIASASTIIGPLSVVADAQNEELEVLYSNATSSTYSTSGVRYIPLAKVANPNEEYVQGQFQARRSGRVRLYIDYAMSVSNGGDLQLDYSGAAIADGGNPDAALGALLSQTFTPGTGTTRKTKVVDTTLDVVPGNDVFLKILRDDDAADTHTGSMNLISVKAVVW